jgi:hypothetical protein
MFQCAVLKVYFLYVISAKKKKRLCLQVFLRGKQIPKSHSCKCATFYKLEDSKKLLHFICQTAKGLELEIHSKGK